MSTYNPTDLLHQLRWRYATKKFDSTKKIPTETWHALEQTLVLAPSSFGLQPWKFYEVSDPAVRAKLLPVSWNQKQIVEASHLVVFAHRKNTSEADVKRFTTHTAKVRNVPESSLETYHQMMVGFVKSAEKGFDINTWAIYQVYIALGSFLTAAAILGIDACPMEGIDRKKYDEILGLEKEGYSTCVAATAGYRSADDKYAHMPKVRFPTEEVINRR